MMRTFAICVLLVIQLTLRGVSQQVSSTDKRSEVICTFADGKQMKVEYNTPPAKRDEGFHKGKLWEPSGSPMFLFTETPLTLGGAVIPDGACSLYVIPEKRQWTLVVNRNVTPGSKYDEKQDLARAPMEIGESDVSVEQLQVALAHMAPKQCNLRMYYEKTGAWAEFHEK